MPRVSSRHLFAAMLLQAVFFALARKFVHWGANYAIFLTPTIVGAVAGLFLAIDIPHGRLAIATVYAGILGSVASALPALIIQWQIVRGFGRLGHPYWTWSDTILAEIIITMISFIVAAGVYLISSGMRRLFAILIGDRKHAPVNDSDARRFR